jgi:hypothetical protein
MSQLYSAPVSVICASSTSPNTININLSPYTAFVPTNYILKTYINDNLPTTSSQQVYSTITNQIVVNELSCLNEYSFQVQLLNDTQSSSFSLKNEKIPVYPVGPISITTPTITSTTVQVIYRNYTTGGFDLSGAVCIIDAPGISYSNLTNTSVTLTNLTQNTTYNLTILFRKTINGFVISSSPSSVPSFKTNASAPVNPLPQPLTDSSSAATIDYDTYTAFTPTSGIVYYNGSQLGTVSTVSTTQVTVTGLTSATTYAGCTLVLTASGARSDSSAAFTIKTFASAPTSFEKISQTTTTINLTFGKPDRVGNITTINVYDSNGKFEDIYVLLVSQTEVQLRYLNYGRTYSGVYIIVSDGTYTSVKSISIDVSTNPAGSPVVWKTTAGGNSVLIEYNDYNAFPLRVSGGIFYNSSGISQGTVTVSSLIPWRQLTVTGLSPITYTDSYIKLTQGNNTSAASNTFTVTPLEIPVVSEYSVDEGFDGTSVYITYITGFNSFTPNNASRLHTHLGTFNGVDKAQSNLSMQFTGLTVQTEYRDCYIILSDGTNSSAHSVGTQTGATFSFYAVGGSWGYL